MGAPLTPEEWVHVVAKVADPRHWLEDCRRHSCCMKTYWVLLKGAMRFILVGVEGAQVMSGLCEAFVTKIGPASVAAGGAFLQVYLVALPSAGVPIRAAAEAAAIPSNLMEEGAALVEGAYYLAVDTRPAVRGGELYIYRFPFNAPHPAPRGWTQ